MNKEEDRGHSAQSNNVNKRYKDSVPDIFEGLSHLKHIFQSNKDAALFYATRGWYVIPIWYPEKDHCECPKKEKCGSPAKHPITINGLKDASLDKLQIEKWWNEHPHANIGIRTGAESGIAVIDLDVGAGKNGISNFAKLSSRFSSEKIRTCIQKTGSGGVHLIFKYPENVEIHNLIGGLKVDGEIFTGIDIRGENGYIVAAPSRNLKGEYTFYDIPVAPMPEWLIKILTTKTSGEDWSEINDDRAKKIYDLVSKTWPSDGRHDFTLALASRMLKIGIPMGMASSVILKANHEILKGVKPHDVADLKGCIRDAYSTGVSANINSLFNSGLLHSIDSLEREIREMWNGFLNEKEDTLKNEAPPTGKLHPDEWFRETDKGMKFHPHDCANDVKSVFPNTVTEYAGPTHQWVGTYWLKDAEPYIKARIEAEGKITPAQIEAAYSSLQNITRVVDPSKMNLTMEDLMPLPDHVIPINDGLLNLKTKVLIEHNPKYFYTEALPRKHIPGAIPEKFLGLLNIMFTGDDDKDVKITQIMETFAWTFMKNYDIQGMVVMHGEGGEGKSIIHGVIGDVIVNVSAVTLDELENDQFAKPDLYGSWANLISESTARAVGSEWFKRLTDGTEIRAARKHGQPFKFKSHAKMIADVNELPEKKDETRAFYRRIIAIIKFNNLLEDLLTPLEIGQFVKDLKDPDELDKIFSYVVDNFYGPLVDRMKFTGQLSTAEAERGWEQFSNPALTFMKAKQEQGLIFTDVENAKAEILKREDLKMEDWIAKEKTGDVYLTTIKNPLIQEGIKWAKYKKYPAKNIDSKSIGSALTTLEYTNITINKRVGKGVTLRVWKDICILPFKNDDGCDGCDGSCQNHPSHQKTPTNTDPLIDVTDPFSNVGQILDDQKGKEKLANTRHRSIAQSHTTEENAVTDGSGGIALIRHTANTKIVKTSVNSNVTIEKTVFPSVDSALKDLESHGFEILESVKAYGETDTWKVKLQGKFSDFTTVQRQFINENFNLKFEGSTTGPHTWIHCKVKQEDPHEA